MCCLLGLIYFGRYVDRWGAERPRICRSRGPVRLLIDFESQFRGFQFIYRSRHYLPQRILCDPDPDIAAAGQEARQGFAILTREVRHSHQHGPSHSDPSLPSTPPAPRAMPIDGVSQVTMFWIGLAVVLFCMPVSIPVEADAMSESPSATPFIFFLFPSPVRKSGANCVATDYASVVFAGFTAISAGWYFVRGRKVFTGPPVVADAKNAEEALAPLPAEVAGHPKEKT